MHLHTIARAVKCGVCSNWQNTGAVVSYRLIVAGFRRRQIPICGACGGFSEPPDASPTTPPIDPHAAAWGAHYDPASPPAVLETTGAASWASGYDPGEPSWKPGVGLEPPHGTDFETCRPCGGRGGFAGGTICRTCSGTGKLSENQTAIRWSYAGEQPTEAGR